MPMNTESIDVLINQFKESGLDLICEPFRQHLLKCIKCGKCLNYPCIDIGKCDRNCDGTGNEKVTN